MGRSLIRRWLEGQFEAHPRTGVTVLFLVVLAIVLRTAWVAEDAFITFRSVEQLLSGNGPRWNPQERVQSFTHPLWFGVLVLGRLATGDPYWASIALGVVFVSATVLLLFRWRGWRPREALWITVLLISSKAWVDYTTSGLENSLSYLLLVCFLISSLRLAEDEARRTFTGYLGALSLFFLLALNRLDTVALTLPTALWLAWGARRAIGSGKTLAALALGSLPLAAWTGFAIVYYGFPFPNTAYAKLNTGIPTLELARQSAWYLWNSLRWDAVVMLTLVWSIGIAWRGNHPLWRGVAVGSALNLLYIARVGGDFMSGRFLTLAYLASAMLFVCQAGPVSRRWMATALLLLLLVSPSHPLRLWFADFVKRTDEAGIADERSFYWRDTSLGVCLGRWQAGGSCPDHEWAREGREFRDSGKRVTVRASIGMFGYSAGLDQIIVDRLALTDPLLARLPIEQPWRIGHFVRKLPEGYLLTILTEQNQIRDPGLRDWYGHLTAITQGPLFSRDRWVTILKMNLGAYRHLLREPNPRSP